MYSLDRLSDQERREGTERAIATAWCAYDQLSEAFTLPMQAAAWNKLADAMSDLATWHPKYVLSVGRIDLGDDE